MIFRNRLHLIHNFFSSSHSPHRYRDHKLYLKCQPPLPYSHRLKVRSLYDSTIHSLEHFLIRVFASSSDFAAVPQANPQALQYRPAQVPAYASAQPAVQQNAAVNNPALQYLINSRMINPGLATHSTPNAALQQGFTQNFPQPAPQALPQALPQAFAQPAPQYRPAAPALQPRATLNTANAATTGSHISNFPQLPGVRLVEIQPRRPAALPTAANPTANIATSNFQTSFSSNLGSNSLAASTATTTPEPDYGPVVINAALLSYDIGSQGRRGTQ